MLKMRNQVRITSGREGKKAITGNPIQRKTSGVATSRQEERSYVGPNNSMSVSALPQGGIIYDTMLSGLLGDNEQANMRFYRDIYDHDSVGGACVDLMSAMPFSDFTLQGCQVAKRVATYESSIERLNLRTILPEVSVDYLVTGAFIATLLYKSKEKKFVDLISWATETCEITKVPFLGIDPMIKVRPDGELRSFINSSEPQLMKMKKTLNSSMIEAMNSESLELDPLTTIFVPRKTFTYATKGTSFFKRILPIYLMEKALYRGTLVEAGRRQRSLLHLAMGDDLWEPMAEEMQAIVALFNQADLDPLGAIVGTRGAVIPTELRQGGEFWKYTDLSEQTTPMKLRALGISESFLSGDATYASMEVSLSVFVENLRNYRNMVTNRVFHGKLFPLIAYVNNFMKKNTQDSSDTDSHQESAAFGEMKLQHNLNDATMLDMPQVHWQKSLRPEADQNHLEVLATLKEHGLPIALSMWASAGGMTMESLLQDLQRDTDIKRKIKEITGIDPDDQQQSQENQEQSRVIRGMLRGNRRSVMSRDFSGFEITAKTKTGKPKAVLNQSRERNRQFDHAVKAVKNMSDPHRLNSVLGQVKSRLGSVPSLY